MKTFIIHTERQGVIRVKGRTVAEALQGNSPYGMGRILSITEEKA